MKHQDKNERNSQIPDCSSLPFLLLWCIQLWVWCKPFKPSLLLCFLISCIIYLKPKPKTCQRKRDFKDLQSGERKKGLIHSTASKSMNLSARAFLFSSSGCPTILLPLEFEPVPNLVIRYTFFRSAFIALALKIVQILWIHSSYYGL